MSSKVFICVYISDKNIGLIGLLLKGKKKGHIFKTAESLSFFSYGKLIISMHIYNKTAEISENTVASLNCLLVWDGEDWVTQTFFFLTLWILEEEEILNLEHYMRFFSFLYEKLVSKIGNFWQLVCTWWANKYAEWNILLFTRVFFAFNVRWGTTGKRWYQEILFLLVKGRTLKR